MALDQRRRVRLVTRCALTYPLVWAGGAAVGYVAGVTSDIETDTRGLGDLIAGFVIGTLMFSVLWAVIVFVALQRYGRTVRACIAALGTPVVVIAGAFSSTTLAVALATVLPATASWWATTPTRTVPRQLESSQRLIRAADRPTR